jgi:hypothetical protein
VATGAFAGTGARPPLVGVDTTPRLIMSCNSSAFDERDNAMSSVMDFAK